MTITSVHNLDSYHGMCVQHSIAILLDDDDVKGSDLSYPTGIKIKRTAGV